MIKNIVAYTINLSPRLLNIVFIAVPNFARTAASLNNWNSLNNLGSLINLKNLDDSSPRGTKGIEANTINNSILWFKKYSFLS